MAQPEITPTEALQRCMGRLQGLGDRAPLQSIFDVLVQNQSDIISVLLLADKEHQTVVKALEVLLDREGKRARAT